MPTQGYKTRFQFSDTPSPSGATVWTDFANINDLKPPKFESSEIDTTVLDSPGQWDTSIPSFANGGTTDVKIQYDKVQQAALFAIFRQPRGFRIMFPDGTTPDTGSTMAFAGFIKTYGNESITKKDITYATIGVRVVGPPTFTAGT